MTNFPQDINAWLEGTTTIDALIAKYDPAEFHCPTCNRVLATDDNGSIKLQAKATPQHDGSINYHCLCGQLIVNTPGDVRPT